MYYRNDPSEYSLDRLSQLIDFIDLYVKCDCGFELLLVNITIMSYFSKCAFNKFCYLLQSK